MRSLPIRVQLLLLGILAGGASLLIAVTSTVGMQRMSELQHQGHARAEDAVFTIEFKAIGARTYRVIADTVINQKEDTSAQRWSELRRSNDEMFARMRTIVDTDSERESLDNARRSYDELVALYETRMLAAVRAQDWAEIRRADDRIDGLVSAFEAEVQKVARDIHAEALEADREFDDASEATLWTNVTVSLLAFAGLLGLGGWVAAGLLGTLGGEPAYAVKVAREIAGGELRQRIRLKAGGDGASLLASMERMREALTRLVAQIQGSATSVSGAAGTLGDAVREVADASSMQSDATAAVSASVEQLTVSIAQVSDGAEIARSTSQTVEERARHGEGVVARAAAEMAEISAAVGDTASRMEALGDQSKHITLVVSVIREIADQTNLLALNAAIEAARAGDQGRGFAVVADEVRKLAERTTNSTVEIANMVEQIQQSTGAALDSMSQGRQRVERGLELTNSAAAAIASVRESSTQLGRAIADISLALGEQRTASAQIAQNVERIAQTTEENTASAAQISASAGELEKLAVTLDALTRQFLVELPEGEAGRVIPTDEMRKASGRRFAAA